MARIVIIGGSDAGISAALRAREVDPSCEVTVILADDYPNFSVCGLPYLLSGEVADWRSLAHRTAKDIEDKGIRLLRKFVVRAISPARNTITMTSSGNRAIEMSYDQLIVATGASALWPSIAGTDCEGVFVLRSMGDAFAVEKHTIASDPKSAVIIGGGYIGLEMADALTRRGLKVTVVEHGATLLKSVLPNLGRLVEKELERHGVRVVTGVQARAIEQDGSRLKVIAKNMSEPADMVIMAAGVAPKADLASSSGIDRGVAGAVRVDRHMVTNIPNISAAGDCAETWHRLLRRSTYLPLGSTAHKQGRVAGENAAGGNRDFVGTLGTQVVKVFDLVIARTGLDGTEPDTAGFLPLTESTSAWDHKPYYPGAHDLHIEVIGDRKSGCLLGAQMVGHREAEVAKRIDVFACALLNGMTVAGMEDIDLSYTPPLGTPWDAIQISTHTWARAAQAATTGKGGAS